MSNHASLVFKNFYVTFSGSSLLVCVPYFGIITTVITYKLRSVNLVGQERSSDRIDLHSIFK